MSGVYLSILALAGVNYWEFAWRRGTRPYGIFQQVNLMASFTACGVLLSALLFYGYVADIELSSRLLW